MLCKMERKGVSLFSFLCESSLPPSKAFLSSPDPLPAPTLSADPRYDVYYEGEVVILKCLAVRNRKIGGFRFFNQSGEQIHLRAPYSLLIATLQLTATKASAGEYTCMYFVEDSGQEILSSRSLPFSIKVQGKLGSFIWLENHQPGHRTPPFKA